MMNLMNHNAGWCESTWAFQTNDEDQIMSLGESLQYSEPRQMYRPGEVASYSNYGAAVAGYVVECITGQPYEGE
jgi:CubicO group peptidase (beta-lactamase class C family)